jgi:hypothetical protein
MNELLDSAIHQYVNVQKVNLVIEKEKADMVKLTELVKQLDNDYDSEK